jgi:hypothetical protein
MESGVSVEQEVTYAQHIRPLFRDRDIRSMSFACDLSSYEDVRANAEAIHERLAAGSMPCDGRWTDKHVRGLSKSAVRRRLLVQADLLLGERAEGTRTRMELSRTRLDSRART